MSVIPCRLVLVSSPQANDETPVGVSGFPVPPAGRLVHDGKGYDVVGYRWESRSSGEPDEDGNINLTLATLVVVLAAVPKPKFAPPLVQVGADALDRLPKRLGERGN